MSASNLVPHIKTTVPSPLDNGGCLNLIKDGDTWIVYCNESGTLLGGGGNDDATEVEAHRVLTKLRN